VFWIQFHLMDNVPNDVFMASGGVWFPGGERGHQDLIGDCGELTKTCRGVQEADMRIPPEPARN